MSLSLCQKNVRGVLYKFLLVLIILNMVKWASHPFGLNISRSVEPWAVTEMAAN